MSLGLLVRRSLRQHAMTTLVTAASLALAGGLVMTVWSLRAQAGQAFADTTAEYDAVLGARGSKLQLVLCALFHLEPAPGTVSGEDLAMISRHPAVARAIPLALGDNYRGWRIVGTVPEKFTGAGETGPRYAVSSGGRLFTPGTREAVAGALAMDRLGWRLGDTFSPYHGLAFDPNAQHTEVYTVVGRLEPTNTPADRVIWIPLDGVQTMEGHDPRLAEHVSAVLLKFRAPTAGMMVDVAINRRDTRLTLAYPIGAVVADLFNRMAWAERVLAVVAWLVAVVAAGSVLAGVQASLAARRRDLAILRALGARRRTVAGLILAEAGAMGLLGAVAALGVHVALLAGAAAVVRAQTGVVITLELGGAGALTAAAGLVGLDRKSVV